MNRYELSLARMMFSRAVAMADGQRYEDLLSHVLGYHHSGFVPVKPQGSIGDRKNDGYVPSLGLFFQVYAPEEPTRAVSTAVKKLEADFAGLYNYWNNIHPIKEYRFAFNDKYNGSFPELEKSLAEIGVKHSLGSCECYLAKHLEDAFMQLQASQMESILGGCVPDPTRMLQLDYSSVNDLMQHVFDSAKSYSYVSALTAPNFGKKIEFNNLNQNCAALLNVGSYQSSSVDDFFSLNSGYLKQSLRDAVNAIYVEELQSATATPDASAEDACFFGILERLSPNASKVAQDAALVIMAYYFESCDIFEDPSGGGNAP